MRIVLIDVNLKLCRKWRERFEGYESVEVREGNLLENHCGDILVTPGNCFGIMDGGFDHCVKEYFDAGGWNAGDDIEERVRRHIFEEYFGEQPVGTSFLVPTCRGHRVRFLAYTPTMRIPKRIDAEAVYDSTRAALIACSKLDAIDDPIVMIPGMGTGYGCVGSKVAAEMMGAAIDSIFRAPLYGLDWDYGYAVEKRIKGIKTFS